MSSLKDVSLKDVVVPQLHCKIKPFDWMLLVMWLGLSNQGDLSREVYDIDACIKLAQDIMAKVSVADNVTRWLDY